MDLQLSATTRVVLFILCSAILVFCSRQSLRNPRSHGFYRFFVFEGILLLLLLNGPFWFHQMFSPQQLVSWALLFLSLLFLTQGFWLLKSQGGHHPRDTDPENFAFENTIHLVTDGIYKRIRHPLYSSLLLLAWGVFFKQMTITSFTVVLITTVFLILTAKTEERENVRFFGAHYEYYMTKSKMFIPYLF